MAVWGAEARAPPVCLQVKEEEQAAKEEEAEEERARKKAAKQREVCRRGAGCAWTGSGLHRHRACMHTWMDLSGGIPVTGITHGLLR